MSSLDIHKLYESITAGDNKSLAQAITLLESTLPMHQDMANQVLDLCLKDSGKSIRIAVTGVPGVGKSTFIEAFGQFLINEHGKKVAVLAIDPSSKRSKGSILGDKTRMNKLSISDNAFVRPSPSGDTLGGVASQTRETIILCEAAGYDIILVETVGVGQSETLVHSMVDFFLLLLLPGAGDELQGIKRGIVEMADMIAINKTQTNIDLANEASSHYQNAINIMQASRSGWKTPVVQIDSLTGLNLPSVYKCLTDFMDAQKSNGGFEENRKKQSTKWFLDHLQNLFFKHITGSDVTRELKDKLQVRVERNEISPRSAASFFVTEVFK